MQSSEHLLEMREITKAYAGFRVLDRLSLNLRRNEIMSIVGQNGAGKSTLMKILCGAIPFDSGEILLNNRPIRPKDPHHAEELGISMVYQEGGLIPDLRVYEYLFLGNEDRFGRSLQRKKMKEDAKGILDYLHIAADPDTYLRDLSAATAKMMEVARSFSTIEIAEKSGSQKTTPIIILDEPTAALSLEEKQSLFKRLEEMRSRATFLFISHVTSEVLRVSDRVCVLRDGKKVGSFDLHDTHLTEEALHQLIVGKVRGEDYYSTKLSKFQEAVNKEAVLRVNNLSKERLYQGVTFDVHKGEILGLYGTLGSGKTEIGKTIAGILKQDEGYIEKDGKRLELSSLSERAESGIGYLSGSHEEQLFPLWSISRNISLPSLDRMLSTFFRVIGFLDPSKEDELAKVMVKKLDVKPPDIGKPSGELSGGNKQKIVLARWLAKNTDVLILVNPTAGVDVGTREELYELFREMAGEGRCLVLISDDLDEVIGLSDRILAIEYGRISKSFGEEDIRKLREKEGAVAL